MEAHYQYNLLKKILSTKINGKPVWKQRIKNQTQFIHLLEDAFGTEITTQTFGFYPNKVYFGTSLTAGPEYTQKMMPTWLKIKKMLEKIGWEVYAPFLKTDPHSKIPDGYNSYQIRDMDHIQVLTAEVGLFDLNRPSHGVGQEIEMSMFMPTIGFSQQKLSRMTKGMPGSIIVNYEDEEALIKILKQIFERKNFRKEPFYLGECEHPTPGVFKGSECMNCLFKNNLHTP